MPQTKEISMLGGVNLFDDPRKIRDDQLCYAKNVAPVIKGVPGKRKAMHVVSDSPIWYFPSIIPFAAYGPLIHMAVAPHPGILSVGVFAGTPTAPSRVQLLTTSSVDPYPGYENPGTELKNRPTIIQYDRSVYVLAGAPMPAMVKATVPANIGAGTYTIGAFTLAGTNNSAISPVTGCVYRDRFVYANLGVGYENYLLMADPFSPDVVGDDALAANGRAMAIGDLKPIIAVVPITQSEVGAPIDTSLLILKEDSAYIMIGEPNLTTDSGELLQDCSINRINIDTGCVSPHTVVTTKHGTFWAGPDDVWFFARGGLPTRVGTNISPALTDNSPDVKYLWEACYFDGFYRLAILAPGQGIATSTAVLGTMRQHQWWLDLRDGVPDQPATARWWGPQAYVNNAVAAGDTRIGTRGLYVGALLDSQPRLYTLIGTMSLYQLDVEGVRDTGAEDQSTPTSITGDDDNLSEITIEIKTKAYDMDAKFQKKGFIALHVDYWTSIANYLKVQTLADGGKETDTSEEYCPATSLELDVDSVETVLAKEPNEVSVYPSDRIVGKTLQFRIYDEYGYFIGEGNDTLVVLSGATYYAVTLTAGKYDDLEALLDHVCTRITAVTGVSASHDVGSRPDMLTITLGSACTFLFQSAGGSITSAQLQASRALGALMGYDTSANTSSSATQLADFTVYMRRAGNWEFNAIAIEYDVFARGAE